MQRLRVMIVTPDADLPRELSGQLPKRLFRMVDVRPGPAFISTAYSESPHIAVLDQIEQRTESAQLEIALLKKIRPGVRIILSSRFSSTVEAPLVEQGIFFYFAGRPQSELFRVVLASAKAFGLRDDEMTAAREEEISKPSIQRNSRGEKQ